MKVRVWIRLYKRIEKEWKLKEVLTKIEKQTCVSACVCVVSSEAAAFANSVGSHVMLKIE